MSHKSRKPSLDQILETIRAHSFEVTPSSEVPGGMLVSKYGVGAVLVASAKGAPTAMAIAPGLLEGNTVARLLDRGHQKFIRTSQFEIPATASHLHAIHQFSEELKLLTGAIDLYNESLGTTSDLYVYDRLKGREALQAVSPSPWERTEGH